MELKGLSREDFKALIQEAVEEALLELMGDPDEGQELREDVKQRLRVSMQRVARGERGMSLEEVAKRVA